MKIQGFRVFDTGKNSYLEPHELDDIFLDSSTGVWEKVYSNIIIRFKDKNYLIEYHTGAYDKNNVPIYEGDLLRIGTAIKLMRVDSTLEFLLECGRYQEKNGVPIFGSAEVIFGPIDMDNKFWGKYEL